MRKVHKMKPVKNYGIWIGWSEIPCWEKSRVPSLKEGNRNTNSFTEWWISGKGLNLIAKVHRGQSFTENPEEAKEEMSHIFWAVVSGKEFSQCFRWGVISWNFFDFSWLERELKEREISLPLETCAVHKALSPDGFSFPSFKEFLEEGFLWHAGRVLS